MRMSVAKTDTTLKTRKKNNNFFEYFARFVVHFYLAERIFWANQTAGVYLCLFMQLNIFQDLGRVSRTLEVEVEG